MARYIQLSQGKRFQMGGGDSRHLVSPDNGASQITMNYSVFQPGHEFPQHIHDLSADIFIVLEGGVSVRQGDSYTPIRAGDFAYIPPTEVHGTVNQTDEQAILISFQSPPDPSLYRGERDPAVTGSVPRPPENHKTTVQIKQLTSGASSVRDGVAQWTPASPETATREMVLWYVELEPGATLHTKADPAAETVWFVKEGRAAFAVNDVRFIGETHSVVFLSPGESLEVAAGEEESVALIRCQSVPGYDAQ